MPYKDSSGIMGRIKVVTNQPDAQKEKEYEELLRKQSDKAVETSQGFKANTGLEAVKAAIKKVLPFVKS